MLKFIGSGALPGIPARDLTDKDIERFVNLKTLKGLGYTEEAALDLLGDPIVFLTNTGLYEKAGAAKKAPAEKLEDEEITSKDGE